MNGLLEGEEEMRASFGKEIGFIYCRSKTIKSTTRVPRRIPGSAREIWCPYVAPVQQADRYLGGTQPCLVKRGDDHSALFNYSQIAITRPTYRAPQA